MNNEQINLESNRKSGGTKVYYVILSIVSAIILVLSFVSYYYFTPHGITSVDLTVAASNAETLASYERNPFEEGTYYEATESLYNKAVSDIDGMLAGVSGLTKVASRRAVESVDKTGAVQLITAPLAAGPTYTIQDFAQSNIDYTLDRTSIRAMNSDTDNPGKENRAYSRQVKNIIVDVPGSSPEADAVLIMTHYDSDIESKGATGASAVAAMIGTIKQIVESHVTYKNELVFVFTDGKYEGSLGAYAFRYQFSGFNDVNSRIKAAVNFDALTTGGSLAVVQASDMTLDNPGDMVGEIANSFAAVRKDTVIPQFIGSSLFSDMDIFYNNSISEWTVPCANVMMVLGDYIAGSQYDDQAYINIEDATSQYAAAMMSVANHFGNVSLPLGGLFSGSGNTWLGLTLGASGLWMIILTVLLLLGIGGSVYLGINSGVINVADLFKGMGLVLLAAIGSTGIEYGVYVLVSLLVAAFGGFTINQVFTGVIVTPAVIIPMLLLNVALSFGFFAAFKRLLRVKAKDCVRGAAYLLSVAGVILGFFFSRLGFGLVLAGLGYSIVTIIISLLKKTGAQNIGKLFLYFVVSVLAMPFAIQTLLVVCNFYAAAFLPLMLLPVGIMLATITPYFSKLTPALEDLFEKLPKHTVIVERTVNEKVEDEAKKGKFVDVEKTVVGKEKVAWKYHTWFGVTALSIVSAIILIICQSISAFTIPAGINTTYGFSFLDTGIENSLFDDSIVCTKVVGNSSYKWVIKDEAVYRRIRNLKGYDYWEWSYNETTKEYSRTINTANGPSAVAFANVENADSVYTITVTPTMAGSSQVSFNFINLTREDVVTVEKEGDVVFTYTYDNPTRDTKFTLPYGYGNCVVKLATNSSSITIKASEFITSENAINNDAYERMEEMKEYFNGIGLTGVKYGYVITSQS